MNKIRALNTADALAGLSLAGLLLPEAVAYSGLANLPPQAGVIGLFAGLICYALIGRSRLLVGRLRTAGSDVESDCTPRAARLFIRTGAGHRSEAMAAHRRHTHAQ